MTYSFEKKKNRRLKYTSKYNVKLYKKCLSFKLLNFYRNEDQPNLIRTQDKSVPLKIIKRIYARKERIPFRLLRFFQLMDYDAYISMGVKFLISKKLGVYNGKLSKPINVHRGLIEVTIRTLFCFGELIFTRARYK